MLTHELQPCQPPVGFPSVAVYHPSMTLFCHVHATPFLPLAWTEVYLSPSEDKEENTF